MSSARAVAAVRAAHCQRAAVNAGLRRTLPVLVVLGRLAAYPRLPHAGQATLARDCGVHPRTVRHWLAALERAGVIDVHRSRPQPGPAGWTRRTNRYVLCDRRCAARPYDPPPRKPRSALGGAGTPLPTGGNPAPPAGGGPRSGPRVLTAVVDRAALPEPPPDPARNAAGLARARAALASRG